MKRIAVVCAFLVVVMAAIVGVLVIFDMMSFDAGMRNMLKFGGAIVVLGIASALILLMMNNGEDNK